MGKFIDIVSNRAVIFLSHLVVLAALGLNTLYIRSVAADADKELQRESDVRYVNKQDFGTHILVQDQALNNLNTTLKEIKQALGKVSINSERLIRIETTLESLKQARYE